MADPVAVKQALVKTIYDRLVSVGRGEVDVVYGLPQPDETARAEWVSVLGASSAAEFEVDQSRNSGVPLSQYRGYWAVTVLVGSGVNHASPLEADRLAYGLAREAALAIDADDTLGVAGVLSSWIGSVDMTEDWPEDSRQVVLTVRVDVMTEGWDG